LKLLPKHASRSRADNAIHRVASGQYYFIELENHDTRYGRQLRENVPQQFLAAAKAAGKPNVSVQAIVGAVGDVQPTSGAFVDFPATSMFKFSQALQIFKLFDDGKICPGDTFFFQDGWNPTILQLRLLSEMTGIPVRIVVLWHAGSYDPFDLLSQKIADKLWSISLEKSLFHAVDFSCFATNFSRRLFIDGVQPATSDSARRCGFPMEYLTEQLEPYASLKKRNLVVFPHRLSFEKQPEIFRDLAREFPDYEFRICQEERLTKNEYHTLLGESAAVFSASLQETLGIGVFEGMCCGAMPILPDRLSYSEMYDQRWRYRSEWTADFDAYLRHKSELVAFIRELLAEFRSRESIIRHHLKSESIRIGTRYFHGAKLYEVLLS